MATTMRELLRQAAEQYERDVQESYQRGMADERSLRDDAEELAAQPVVLPTGIGAVVTGQEKGGTLSYTFVNADTTDPGSQWFQPATGDWYSVEELRNEFYIREVLNEGWTYRG